MSTLAAQGQVIHFEFNAQSSASNTIKTEWYGVTATGTVDVNYASDTLNFSITNTTSTGSGHWGRISGFDFNDPYDPLNLWTSDWNLTSSSKSGWDDDGSVTFLGDGTYNSGNPDSFSGAETDWWVGTNTNFINPGETATFTFEYDGDVDMQQIVDAWQGGSEDLRFRFQNIDGNSSWHATNWDKFSTDLTVVPEPSFYGVLGSCALICLIAKRHLRKNKSA